MTISRTIGSISAACAAAVLFAAPVVARPYHHRPHVTRVCKWTWRHHHRVRVCHTVHRR